MLLGGGEAGCGTDCCAGARIAYCGMYMLVLDSFNNIMNIILGYLSKAHRTITLQSTTRTGTSRLAGTVPY